MESLAHVLHRQNMLLSIFSVIGLSAALPRSAHLGKLVVHAPPRSRIGSITANGSSIPAGGAVWPTAIYWSLVQVGTPPVDFPAAIDSGSGDLDISGKVILSCYCI